MNTNRRIIFYEKLRYILKQKQNKNNEAVAETKQNK